MSAQAFAASLGPGVNIMAANIRHDVLDEHDFIGLGHRIGHIRLCGDVLKGLINWSTCRAHLGGRPRRKRRRGD